MSPSKQTSRQANRDGRRVFAAIPFKSRDSVDPVWETIQFACRTLDLRAVRADAFNHSGSIMEDVWAELRQCGIVVADLTGLNPNVIYELGIAEGLSCPVVLLCHSGQPAPNLPFDFKCRRIITYELSNNLKGLYDDLFQALKLLCPRNETRILRGKEERSRQTISDMKMLLKLENHKLEKECVWFSGFLSTLAIDEAEGFSAEEDEYRRLLLEDKRMMLELARHGCVVRFILSPPHPDRKVDDLLIEGPDTTIKRLRSLIALLNSDEAALRNMEFVVSPCRQKHLYIIGHISTSEGFKLKLEKGYQLTLRQDSLEGVQASIDAQEILFEELKRYTLETYSLHDDHAEWSARYRLRLCTIRALEQSLDSALAQPAAN